MQVLQLLSHYAQFHKVTADEFTEASLITFNENPVAQRVQLAEVPIHWRQLLEQVSHKEVKVLAKVPEPH